MPDEPRLLAHATGAFVDRTPIDWSALLSRVRTSPDRALFENLYALSAVRGTARAAPASAESRASAAAWVVVALGSVETVFMLGLLASALLQGESIGGRTPQLILALAFAASSVPLGAATFRDPRSLFLLATFIVAATTFTRSAVSGLPAPWSAPVHRLLHGVWFDAFVPACLWEFALGFPRVPRFTRFDRFGRRAVAALWILSGLLFACNFVASRVGIQTRPVAHLARDHSSHLFWSFFTVSLAGALIAILVRARRAPLNERRKVARLASVIAGGLAPFLLLGVARTAVPAVDHWFRAADSMGSVWVYRVIVAALAATPVLSATAVLADRPFDRQAVFGRRGRLLRLRSRVSRRAALHDGRVARALERLARARGTRETIANLSQEIRDLLGVRTVDVLLRERSQGLAPWSNGAMSLSPNGGLAAVMRETAEPLDVSPAGALLTLLPHDDRDWVIANAVHLIAPLIRRDGEIAVVVAIGAKASGAPFERRDRWLTVALMASAAAAFDDDGRSSSVSDAQSLRSAAAAAHDEMAFECPRCGVVTPSQPLPCACGRAPALAVLPHWIGEKFRVERRVGSGGMGVVYLAHDEMLDRDVALKTLPRLRPDAVQRLRDEARAMAALNHESLATLYGLEIWRSTPVLVVEYFPNGTLAQRLSDGPLSPGETVALGVRLARALVYMHARAVLHRDLKPSNIAFTASDACKLLDFGLATLSRPTVHALSGPAGASGERFVGTIGYAPPEALRGTPSSPDGDRWALAVVMLEAASGVNPFATAHRAATQRGAMHVDVSAFRSSSLRAAPELRAFLESALDPSPEHRFRTSGDFLAALEDVADAVGVRVGD